MREKSSGKNHWNWKGGIASGKNRKEYEKEHKKKYRKVFICEECGDDYTGGHKKSRRWCIKCRFVECKCKNCDKNFLINREVYQRRGAKYCSLGCSIKETCFKEGQFVGSKSPLWKGGITEINHLIRRSREYQDWRKDVYERDEWTCRICGKHCSTDIVAHHIKSFNEYPRLRFDIENGVTLCRSCHIKVHKWLGTL